MVHPLNGVDSLGILLNSRAIRGNEGNGSDTPIAVQEVPTGISQIVEHGRAESAVPLGHWCVLSGGLLGPVWERLPQDTSLLS